MFKISLPLAHRLTSIYLETLILSVSLLLHIENPQIKAWFHVKNQEDLVQIVTPPFPDVAFGKLSS